MGHPERVPLFRAVLLVWLVGVALLYVSRDIGLLVLLGTVIVGQVGARRWGWRLQDIWRSRRQP
jgi:hypothetical protein